MKNTLENLWQTREFASRAKVTVRTLHHYDRLGILKPRRYTSKGFRLYSEAEFARLQQILTLKFIGFSLKQIKEILKNSNFDLGNTLRLQREVLTNQRRRLNAALAAIDQAEKLFAQKNAIDWESFHKIIGAIDMEQNMEWTKKYYSEEAQAKIEERKKLWTPELQERVSRDWNQLFGEIETALKDGAEPTSERAQQLAARWKELLIEFTGGDPGIQAGLNKLYADEVNWQGTFQKPFSNEIQEFIFAAMKVAPEKSVAD